MCWNVDGGGCVFGQKRFFCPVISPVSAHKKRFGDVVPTQREVDVMGLPVQFYRIYLCGELMDKKRLLWSYFLCLFIAVESLC